MSERLYRTPLVANQTLSGMTVAASAVSVGFWPASLRSSDCSAMCWTPTRSAKLARVTTSDRLIQMVLSIRNHYYICIVRE